MIKSMTAYGRFSKETALGLFVVEIHSVNRKMLDVSIYLPKELLRFEVEVRKWIMAQIERGQVTVRIAFQPKSGGKRSEQTLGVLRDVQQFWCHVADELGFDSKKEIDLKFLVEQMLTVDPVDLEGEEESIKGPLKEAVEGALVALMGMKKIEGAALVKDIQGRLSQIKESLGAIEMRKEEPLKRYQKKIEERLQEIAPLTPELQDRMCKEVALLAEKSDITEEVVRAYSHIQQFRGNLECAKQAIGRTLDFLVQEMHREVNTLSSKSLDTEISSCAVKIKSELEKIREQVQNIE